MRRRRKDSANKRMPYKRIRIIRDSDNLSKTLNFPKNKKIPWTEKKDDYSGSSDSLDSQDTCVDIENSFSSSLGLQKYKNIAMKEKKNDSLNSINFLKKKIIVLKEEKDDSSSSSNSEGSEDIYVDVENSFSSPLGLKDKKDDSSSLPDFQQIKIAVKEEKDDSLSSSYSQNNDYSFVDIENSISNQLDLMKNEKLTLKEENGNILNLSDPEDNNEDTYLNIENCTSNKSDFEDNCEYNLDKHRKCLLDSQDVEKKDVSKERELLNKWSPDDPKNMRLIFTSDINLGYEETTKRDLKEDSFITFEEILQFATQIKAHALVITGNLFWKPEPPSHIIQKCIKLLRKYCLSTESVNLECIGDPNWVFSHCDYKIFNFKDPNLNIKLPIFAVYGNRDKPVLSRQGPLDLLATTGLLNYFGKLSVDSKDDISLEINPVVLCNLETAVALYGMDYTNEGQLNKLLKDEKLSFTALASRSKLTEFLVLNEKRKRGKRPENLCFSMSLIPDSYRVIVWGGEPDYRRDHLDKQDRLIIQPGSTTVVSLTQRQAKVAKKISYMRIFEDKYHESSVQLKTVRPFVYDQIDLLEKHKEISSLREKGSRRITAIEKYVDRHIEDKLIPESQALRTGHPQQPVKPLIRLKIFYVSDDDRFDTRRLAEKYKERVANPQDMIFFSNRALLVQHLLDSDEEDDELRNIFLIKGDKSKNWIRTVEQGISEHFSIEENRKKMNVLSVDQLNKALDDYKNKKGSMAIERTTREQIIKSINFLCENEVAEDKIQEALSLFKS